jgi:hypothetical protein
MPFEDTLGKIRGILDKSQAMPCQGIQLGSENRHNTAGFAGKFGGTSKPAKNKKPGTAKAIPG